MPDGAPQTGQGIPLVRVRHKLGLVVYGVIEDGSPTHVAHSLDPKALAVLRDAVAEVLFEETSGWLRPINDFYTGVLADAVMVRLGLTPPEPKEGGAS